MRHHQKTSSASLLSILLSVLVAVSAVSGQNSEFTYQGKLTDNVTGSPYDIIFRLCSTETGDCSSPLAADTATGVTPGPGGIFSVVLDFGTQNYHYFNDRFVEIAVRRNGETGYTTLSPRTKLTGAPVAIYARKAEDALTLEGLGSADFIQDNDPRIQDGYNVRNGSTFQPGVNFNIGGTGSAGVLNASSYFTLGGNRVLQATDNNLSVGLSSGPTTTGLDNTFFGFQSGRFNTIGEANTFLGSKTGGVNTTGHLNTFLGYSTGRDNSTGISNTFLGAQTGMTNTTGNNNTLIGAGSQVMGGNLTYATAIGAGTTVTQPNSVVLGRSNDLVQVPGRLNAAQFYLTGTRILNYFGNNLILSDNAGSNITSGIANTFVGGQAGRNTTSGFSNVFVGFGAGNPNTAVQVSNSIAIGVSASVSADNSVAIGRGATATTANTVVLGTASDNTSIPGKFEVIGGGSTPSGGPIIKSVVSTHSSWGPGIAVNSLHVGSFPQVFLNTPLCFQALGVSNHLSVGLCPSGNGLSSSKTETRPFDGGMEIVKRLRPMIFKWKEEGSTGIGLNAEEVASVDPRLVARDDKGDILKVSESSLNAILINSLKQQQQQIDLQQKQIDELKKLLCATSPEAAVCKEEK